MSKILILDDDRKVLSLVNEILISDGHQIAFIPKGEFLFQRLENDFFDLLILDINLPGVNGIELLKQFRAKKDFRQIPVIMMTGEDQRNTITKCFEAGANDYINKPINEEELKARVTSTIQAYKFKELELKTERQKALQSKMMMCSAQMNPHFIFNALGSVQSFVMNEKMEEALEFLSEFTRLMRLSLENSLHNYISIEDEIAFLTKYMQLEKIRFEHKFDYEIEINIEDSYDYYVPPMLLQPFIENAIIHGLSKMVERKGVLSLIIDEKEESIVCTITDNGIGRNQAKKNTISNHKSVAINNIDTRMQILNALNNTDEFKVNIVDIIEDNEPCGTRVEVIFPNDLH